MTLDPLFDFGEVVVVTAGARGLDYGPTTLVDTISAGSFLTDIANAWEPGTGEAMPNDAGRSGQPSEIGTAALMAASNASSFPAGALLRVDGDQR